MDEFSKIKEINNKDSVLNRSIGSSGTWIAHGLSYGAGILAIMVLSAIFAQNLGRVFQDQQMRAIGYSAAIAVGGSSIIFLLFHGILLKSRTQFWAACFFVGLEISLLSLGALFSLGASFGWEFPAWLEWVERIAIVFTLPIVGVEWIVVKALDPSHISRRNEVQTQSQVMASEDKAKKHAKLSNTVLTIRQQGILAKVIGEEMERLPPAQQDYFMRLILKNNEDELKDIKEVLEEYISDKASHNAITSAPSVVMPKFQEPVSSGNGKAPKA